MSLTTPFTSQLRTPPAFNVERAFTLIGIADVFSTSRYHFANLKGQGAPYVSSCDTFRTSLTAGTLAFAVTFKVPPRRLGDGLSD
jgi:hypothetical protein